MENICIKVSENPKIGIKQQNKVAEWCKENDIKPGIDFHYMSSLTFLHIKDRNFWRTSKNKDQRKQLTFEEFEAKYLGLL